MLGSTRIRGFLGYPNIQTFSQSCFCAVLFTWWKRIDDFSSPQRMSGQRGFNGEEQTPSSWMLSSQTDLMVSRESCSWSIFQCPYLLFEFTATSSYCSPILQSFLILEFFQSRFFKADHPVSDRLVNIVCDVLVTVINNRCGRKWWADDEKSMMYTRQFCKKKKNSSTVEETYVNILLFLLARSTLFLRSPLLFLFSFVRFIFSIFTVQLYMACDERIN